MIADCRTSKIENRNLQAGGSKTRIFDFRVPVFEFLVSMNIRIYTLGWCPDCRQAKRFLEESQLPYEEIDIENDAGAAKFVRSANNGKRKVPTFDVDGRIFSCSPFSAQSLKQELGL